ncbi:unnamed protein product [Prunus armeniaca]
MNQTEAIEEANAKEADKVANQLQSTGIPSVEMEPLLLQMYVAVFVFHYPHYLSLGVGGGTSAPKQEEVKRLLGEKIKKKERLLKIFVFEDH